MSKTIDIENTQTSTDKNITYSDVAAKLLKDKFLLTALELHTELIESGREVRQLKDFFSNPGNFESQTQEFSSSRISRSESQATLDSLDLTRYSEDGAGTDERVAVLEFELRKAKETINALRNNLTVATESETSTPDKGSLRNISIGTIKPHEQRALNFLINEYLLLHGYKLTSITFADENQNQDFDDWDDVGLNISKPPELLILYREGLKQTGQNSSSRTTQTDCDFQTEQTKNLSEIDELKTKLQRLESDHLELKNSNDNLRKENELLSSQILSERENLIPQNNADKNNFHSNYFKDNNNKESVESESPERFEIIDKNMLILFNQQQSKNKSRRDSFAGENDNISNNSFNTNDWTNISMNTSNAPQEHDNASLCERITKNLDLNAIRDKEVVVNSNSQAFYETVSNETFLKEVFSLCYVNIPQKIDSKILDTVFNNAITLNGLIHVLSSSLLKIIPNIILNKREEAIPLLMSAVLLNPDGKERDKLLQQLFNLKKKPSESERMMILTGIVGIAKFSEESLVESEILPQCWEQLTHKHVERRLLVAETCTALIPYVSSQIRNSLILSMLQQMLDDREEVVRGTVIKTLSLVVALCDDTDKYAQCEELAFSTLNDPSSNIVNLSTQVLFPVLSKFALNIDRLRTSLLKFLLQKFNDYVKDNEASQKSSNKILRIINVIENLLPFLLISVVYQENILSRIDKDMAIEIRPDFAKLCTNLTHPTKFYKSDVNIGMLLYEFDRFIETSPDVSWPDMDWILDVMIPDLLNNLNHIEINQHVLLQSFINLFSHICIVFGKTFTKHKILPKLRAQIQSLEQILTNFNQYCPNLNIIPVYLVSVLSYCDESEEKEELSSTFRKFLCALPLCGTPLDCLEVTVKKLCELGLQELIVTGLWEGVVHQRPLVRAASASLFAVTISSCCCDKNLLNLKITPALVTLASDSDILVRTAAIPALGSLIVDCNMKEIHDKVYMQIQSYLADPNLKENHSLLRQMIVTLGTIVNSCTDSFRQEVIIPHLCRTSTHMLQMTNQTRKIDMALALVEAFTSVIFSPFNKSNQNSGAIVSALQCLETVVTENSSLISHRDTVLSMLKECDNLRTSGDHHHHQQISSSALQSPIGGSSSSSTITSPTFTSDRLISSSSSSSTSNKITQNVNQSVEEMRQRISKMFNKPSSSNILNKPNTLPNFQGILFKKK